MDTPQNNDLNRYTAQLSTIRQYTDFLEGKYERRLPGSPLLTNIILDFYRSNPKNFDFQRGYNLLEEFNLLMEEIKSDKERYDQFLACAR